MGKQVKERLLGASLSEPHIHVWHVQALQVDVIATWVPVGPPGSLSHWVPVAPRDHCHIGSLWAPPGSLSHLVPVPPVFT